MWVRGSSRTKARTRSCAARSATGEEIHAPGPAKASRTALYNHHMSHVFSLRMLSLSLLLLPLAGMGLGAQAPQPPAAATPPQQDPNRQVIRRNLDIITTDVIVRD